MVTYTPQLLFDTVAQALMLQGSASVNAAENLCLYRAPDGKKCAVGHLIPDNRYDRDMEDQAVVYVVTDFDLEDLFPADTVELLQALQAAHDTFLARDGLEAWKEQMRLVAVQFDLDPQQVM